MSFKQLEYSVDNYVATITLNRPDSLNALTRIMEKEIRQAMEQADIDPDVRAIVLTGSGRGFCAGMDMDELSVLPPGDIRDQQWMRPYDMNRRADYQTRYSYFPAVRKPIITAINGATAGLGLVLALYSDIRFASSTAVFSTAFAKRGLIAEHGIAWILPRVVGHAQAIDLLFSSRKVSAQEALNIGMVSRLAEPQRLLEEAQAYAHDLAKNVSPRSISVMKRQLWNSPYQTLGEAIEDANEEMALSIQSADFKEGVEHFLQRRQAAFTGE
jgi:enoyl-CoA hydratase/carnithine racemase